METNYKSNCEKVILTVNYPLGGKESLYPLFMEPLDSSCLGNVQIYEHASSFSHEKESLGSS